MSSQKIEDLVINKLSDDEKSFKVYKSLYEKLNEKEDSSFDLYLKLYNKGIPLVRLFEYQTIIKSYSEHKESKNPLKKAYKNLIINKENYINDERRIEYFNEFLKNYNIIPATN